MDVRTILSSIDHTLLKPIASLQDIETLCAEAIKYHTASACIPPCYVQHAKQQYGNSLVIGTVVGFPLGYDTTQSKVEQARIAVTVGADELDMVINLCDVKNGAFEQVLREIEQVRGACPNKTLKVIIETCYLTQPEKMTLCEIVTASHADFIKTSTGTAFAGADLADIKLFKEHLGPQVKIKAAGGIRTLADIEAFLNAGCARIGASGAITLLRDLDIIPD